MTATSAHECPGPCCEKRVPAHQLACRRHWYQVSRETRVRVWDSWAGGRGAGTAEHRDSMAAAISEMSA